MTKETTRKSARSTRQRLGALLGCAGLSCALFASLTAGGGAGASVRNHSTSVTTLDIAEVPGYQFAATELGQVKGIFAHYGLKIVLKPASDVTIILADLHSGQDQIGFSTSVGLIHGDEKGQSIKCVAPVETTPTVFPTFPLTALMVAANSSITSPKQLVGKTVGLISTAGDEALYLKIAVDSAGGDYTKVNLTKLTFSDMAAALKSGAIQAAVEVQPFIKIGEAAGDQKVLETFEKLIAGDTTECYVATDSYLDAHRSLLVHFVEAQDQSILYAEAHPASASDEIPAVSGLTAAQAKESTPPKIVYTDNLKPNTISKFQGIMAKYGDLEGPGIAISQLVWVAPGTPMKKLYFDAAGKYTGPAT